MDHLVQNRVTNGSADLYLIRVNTKTAFDIENFLDHLDWGLVD